MIPKRRKREENITKIKATFCSWWSEYLPQNETFEMEVGEEVTPFCLERPSCKNLGIGECLNRNGCSFRYTPNIHHTQLLSISHCWQHFLACLEWNFTELRDGKMGRIKARNSGGLKPLKFWFTKSTPLSTYIIHNLNLFTTFFFTASCKSKFLPRAHL